MRGVSNMKTLKYSAPFLLMALLSSCGQQLVEFSRGDGAQPDTAKVDLAGGDGVNTDATNTDVANTDIANIEVANADLANADAVTIDTVRDTGGIRDGTMDVASLDVSRTDTPASDAGILDGNGLDAALMDAPVGDARVFDVPIIPIMDASNIDGSIVDGGDIIDVSLVDATTIDNASTEAEGVDLGNVDGSGSGPVIVINLGLATPFAIAATAGVTNTPTLPITHINGDVVLMPNQTCNAVVVDNAGGFGLCDGEPPTISGRVITSSYPDTTTASAIKADLNAAFLSITPLAGPPAVGSLGGGTAIAAPTTLGDVAGSALVLGDNWFTPGVYTSITSILITGDITLDGQGDPNAIFIFQSASSLTTADGAPSPGAHARILLTNGVKASNVWWQVGSSATIGLYAEFQGNILAAFSITMKTGSTACGRSMAGAWVGGAGAYVFDSNVVSVPGNGCPL
jgi:hypothetical protein